MPGSLLYQYSFSPRTVLTGFSGVIWLDANTYGLNPTRCQTRVGANSCTGANYVLHRHRLNRRRP